MKQLSLPYPQQVIVVLYIMRKRPWDFTIIQMFVYQIHFLGVLSPLLVKVLDENCHVTKDASVDTCSGEHDDHDEGTFRVVLWADVVAHQHLRSIGDPTDVLAFHI